MANSLNEIPASKDDDLQKLVGKQAALILKRPDDVYIRVFGILEYNKIDKAYSINLEGCTNHFWQDNVSGVAGNRIFLNKQ